MKIARLRADVLAGLTSSFALVPECIAFALVAQGLSIDRVVALKVDEKILFDRIDGRARDAQGHRRRIVAIDARDGMGVPHVVHGLAQMLSMTFHAFSGSPPVRRRPPACGKRA